MIDEAVEAHHLMPRAELLMREWLDGSREFAVKKSKKAMRAPLVAAFDV